MSDLWMPTGAPDELPISPAGENQGPSPGGLAVATLTDYLLVWEPPGTSYLQGETRPLQWKLTRADGGNCSVPTVGTIVLTGPDAAAVSLVPELSLGAPAVSIVAGALGSFPLVGPYLASISLTVDDEVVESEISLVVGALADVSGTGFFPVTKSAGVE